MTTSSIQRGRRKKKRGKESVGKRKGTDMGGVYQVQGAKPHKLQPVGEILTESAVTQPCSMCTENHNFNISTSECIRYPPKCAFSRVRPIPPLGASILEPSALDLPPKLPNETKIGTPNRSAPFRPIPIHLIPIYQERNAFHNLLVIEHNSILLVFFNPNS